MLLKADPKLCPCGLGARDTLRLEASMPLYGHEMDDSITPFEASLAFAVKMEKDDFIGKKALVGKTSPARVRVGITLTGRGIARGAEDVFADDRLIGKTTSGTFCPYVKQAIAMALVSTEKSHPGQTVAIDVRGRKIEGSIVDMPFYSRK
jgi:aminomethyltransferase